MRVLLFVLLSAAAGLVQADVLSDAQILRIQADDAQVRAQLGMIFGHIRYDSSTGVAEVEADAYARSRLVRLGIDWQVDAAATAAYRAYLEAGVRGLRAIPGYACYRTVEETHDTIDTLVATYPHLASVVEIGDSWRKTQNPANGYPLRVLRLRNDAVSGTKPVFFAMSSVHAREYTPAELMTRFAEHLLASHGSDADATWLLDNNEFHLLLQANPDGRKRAEANVLWRKNENTVSAPCPGQPTGNSHAGIDLNRNYPWGWGGAGTSNQACSATYRGPVGASEPETQAVTQYLTTIFPDRRPGNPMDRTIPADTDTQGLFLDVHSYTGLVLWPWGDAGTTGNNAAYIHLGRRLAWFNGYEPKQSVALYPTSGTTIDFAYGERGVPAFTYELGTAFFQDCNTFLNQILPDNIESLLYGARAMHAPYQLPAGPDAYDVSVSSASVLQGEPVQVSARIDDTRYQTGPGAASATQAIAGATVYLNRLPWQPGSDGLAMAASDGNFNQTVEAVQRQLATRFLAPGRYMLVVQGQDAAGEHGPPSAVFLDVIENDDLLFGHDFELPR